MGNYRFKLSDMIPNAWFYKLRDMGSKKPPRNQNPTTPHHIRKKNQQSSKPSTTQQQSSSSSSKPRKQPHQFNPRKSYYFTRELRTEQQPRKPSSPSSSSSKQRPKRRTCSPNKSMSTKSNSSSSSSTLDTSAETESPDPQFRTDRVLPTESSFHQEDSCCGCRVHHSNATDDITIDVDSNSIPRKSSDGKLDDYGPSLITMLPPIVTKAAKFNDLVSDAKRKEAKPRSRMVPNEEPRKGSLKVKIVKEDTASVKEQRNSPVRRLSLSSHGARRLRINSPRRVQARGGGGGGRKSVSQGPSRRSLSDSFAVVKSSLNPQRDFRESMVEMIVQNNIRTCKDLEDLLACYLSLNSDEYHGLIIKVFKQIWLDLTDIT